MARTEPFNGAGFARMSAAGTSGGEHASVLILSTQTATPGFAQPGKELLFNATVVLDAPVAGLLSPTSGPTEGGTVVTIRGAYLLVLTGVTFGGVPAATFSATTDEVTAVAPPHEPGFVEVTISTLGGTGSAVIPFEYIAPPDLTPPTASGLTIARSAFRAANGGDSVAEAPSKPGRTGGTVTYDLSEPATTTFTVARVSGKGRDCVPPRNRDGDDLTITRTRGCEIHVLRPWVHGPSLPDARRRGRTGCGGLTCVFHAFRVDMSATPVGDFVRRRYRAAVPPSRRERS